MGSVLWGHIPSDSPTVLTEGTQPIEAGSHQPIWGETAAQWICEVRGSDVGTS